jgi:ERCC4-related helicase
MVTYQTFLLPYSSALQHLEKLVADALDNIENDPEILRLQKSDDLKSKDRLAQLLISRKTPCQRELTRFLRSAMAIHYDLGPWAADLFINACIKRFYSRVNDGFGGTVLVYWENDEKNYIASLLYRLNAAESRQWGSAPDILSEKANLLVQTLAEKYSPGFRAIIFAKERNEVVMLSHLLSVHPLMNKIFPGHFVGGSGYTARRSSLSEFIHIRDQKDAIDDLRTGKKNVLVATTVLEE